MPRPDLTPEPSSRTLRVFAFDPSLATQIDNAGIAEIAVAIPWEPNLQPGPVGEYIEVHSVRTAQRRTARGSTVTDLVVEITQRRRGFFDPEVQKRLDSLTPGSPMPPKCDFIHRAGCTLIIDAESRCPSKVRVIRTPGDITDNARLEAVRRFLCEGGLEPANAFEAPQRQLDRREPFALIHRHGDH